jgi:Ca-activated chloride channel homolog
MVGLIDSARRSFLRNSTLAFALTFVVSATRLCQAQEISAPTIKVDVSRVNVGVIATDKQGKFVEGLQKSDFHIFDNGIEQPIAGFLANDDPAQVVIMIECGPSVYFVGKANVQKADALIANLAPNDRAAIVCYSSGAAIQSELEDGLSAARTALRELDFGLGVTELNLAKSVLAVLNWLGKVPGKKTVVIIGSGVDSSPPENSTPFKEYISSTDVRILAVSTSRQLRRFPKKHKHDLDEREDRAELQQILRGSDAELRDLTDATGGRVYFPKSTKDYEKIYSEIAQIVRHEYNLAFAPPTPDGKLHTLTVTANHAFRIDHRQAYLAPGASAN